ncbi:hypothetical protein BGZ59_007313 [Podila verticillata]|nr:hypothetical protein BGZ59_007313 [Podila verticillata]KFH71485.1 hypothetical protein MVEG_01784 [Podila verticillata NRRL 6337]
MSDAFPIPLECLQLVITNLAIKRDLKTLASLLRVSKHVCLATLPILYEDPFVWFAQRDQGQQNIYRTHTYSRAIPVTRLLLTSIPKESYSGLVKAMYGISDATEFPKDITNAVEDPPVANDESTLLPLVSQHWPINYLSYVRHFDTQDQNEQSVLTDLVPHVALEPRLKSYVEKHKLVETYAATALNLAENEGTWYGNEESPTTIHFLKLDINREATWVLCSPILEQLQSITIPLSDIGRYLDSISRLSSLSIVIFKLDEYCDVKEIVTGEEEISKLRGLKEKRKQDLESAVKFVQMHTTMFCTLRQVLCPNDRSSSMYAAQSCPVEYLDRMLECLPSLIDPKELVNKNWKQFVSKTEQTNLKFVEKIHVWDKEAIKYYQQFKAKPFLHRCSSLREYHMISLGPDSFKWATQKSTSTGLPPLEVVSIRDIVEPFGSELDDIGLSFGATIKSFAIQWSRLMDGQTRLSQSLVIGRGWKMPLLSKLEFTLSIDRLVLDPDFLRHCPSLRRLTLGDSHQVYNLNEIEPSRPTHLPKLTTLLLSGSGALSFHPDTLYSTKELKVLSLGTLNESRRTLLPSLQDMDQDDHQQDTTMEASTFDLPIHRPKWTWDWYLPLLDSLQLTFEFTFHFKFQMLQGTPNLRSLCLSLYSTGHQVERVLTKDDFTISRQQDRDEDNGNNTNNFTNNSKGNKPTASRPAAPKDPSSRLDLHSQSTQVLSRIRFYLSCLHANRMHAAMPQQPRHPQQVPLTEQQLQEFREGVMLWDRFFEELDVCPNHPDGDCPEESPEDVAKVARTLEEFVDQAGLQPELEATLARLQVWQAREWQEKEDLERYRAEHPEQLVVPSVRRLDIFGHWTMSDEVLEIMLGRVFRNARELRESMMEGYSLDTLVRVTQTMPWLEYVHSVNLFNPASLSDEYKLQPDLTGFVRRPPFLNDAAIRVRYCFVGHQSYYRSAIDGTQATEKASVE